MTPAAWLVVTGMLLALAGLLWPRLGPLAAPVAVRRAVIAVLVLLAAGAAPAEPQQAVPVWRPTRSEVLNLSLDALLSAGFTVTAIALGGFGGQTLVLHDGTRRLSVLCEVQPVGGGDGRPTQHLSRCVALNQP